MTQANPKTAGRRISRRAFNATCPLALLPAAWLTLGDALPAAEETGAARPGADPRQLEKCVDRAVGYLSSRGQAADGSFSRQAGVGVTMLVTTAVLRNGRGPSDPLVARSLKFIEAAVQPDGGLYSKGGMIANYETCLAIMCLSEANADKRYDRLIRRATAFVKTCQIGADGDLDRADTSLGGSGYGKKKRPDLSNTAFLLDALKATGASADDPAMQRALIFVLRCQNLETESNTTPFAAKNPDGGFYYSCVGKGESPAGTTANGGLRSYGAMTYAGLKSMLYAGLKPDDPRVKAAIAWIGKNYDLKSNPGLGSAGLYYYYHLYARALDALGSDWFEDAAGRKHDWRRKKLAEELIRRQQANGSWTNENNKWLESDPNLATGFALLALSYCRPPKPRKQ